MTNGIIVSHVLFKRKEQMKHKAKLTIYFILRRTCNLCNRGNFEMMATTWNTEKSKKCKKITRTFEVSDDEAFRNYAFTINRGYQKKYYNEGIKTKGLKRLQM